MYVCPLVKPFTVAECEVPPVVENTLGIEAYGVPAVVAYLHVAFSSVVSDKVVWVVPAGSVPEGCPFEITGGVMSCASPMGVLMSL